MPNPKEVLRSKAKAKASGKNFGFYVGCGVVACVLGAFFFHAEQQASAERTWAANYERRCEVCQTMIVSSIMTKSMIEQQEKKRIEEEHAENPEVPKTQQEPVRAQAVLRYFCEDNQIDHLLGAQPLKFGDGFSTNDPNFKESIKKLCWLTKQDDRKMKVFKKMLETPLKPIQNPTLVAVSKSYFQPVCGKVLKVCTAQQLELGMIDVEAEELKKRAAAAKDAVKDAAGNAAGAATAAAGAPNNADEKFVPGTHTEL